VHLVFERASIAMEGAGEGGTLAVGTDGAVRVRARRVHCDRGTDTRTKEYQQTI